MNKTVISFLLGSATCIVVLWLIVVMFAWYSIDQRMNNKETRIGSPSSVVSYFNVFHLTNNLPVKIEDAKCKFLTLPGHRINQVVFFQSSQTALDLYVDTLKIEKQNATLLGVETIHDKINAENMNILGITGWDTHALTNINFREVFYITGSGSNLYIYSCGAGPVVDVFLLVRF